MRRKLAKITALAALSAVAIAAIVAGAFYVRLAQGPVSLDFMTGTIQSQINANLSGMQVSIGGVLIERAAATGIPQFRLRNISLTDRQGNVIARAPRAAIGVEENALLTGSIVPKSLQLIGPRILVRRNLQGGIELGFGAPAAAENEIVVMDATDPAGGAAGKTDQQPAPDSIVAEVRGGELIEILAGQDPALGTPISSSRNRKSTS